MVFTLMEVRDATAGLAASRAWNDLGKVDMVPVIVTEDALTAEALKETLAGF